MEMGDFNHSLSRREGNLIIFAETSGMVEPGEGTFDHPSPRELFPLMRFDFFRNINVKAELTLRIRNKSATISSICTELLDRRIPPIPSFRSKYPAFCVMNIGSMNHNRQQTAQHIHYNVPLPAFRFFPPSIPRSSLAATVFTLWESMIA